MYPTPQNIQVDKLFQPGERWGWETWNPQDFVKPFPNQPPVRPKGLTGSIWSKGAMWSSPIGQIFQIWFIAIIVIILTLIIPSKVGPSDAVIRLFVITLVLVLALRYTLPWIVYIIKMQQWKNEKYAHDVAEQNFINSLPIYGTVAPWAGTRRVDVYGGTSTSWQALLTTYGGSCLASGNHLTIIDLSEEGVAEALTQLAMRRLFTVNTLHLPQQLPQFDAFANLTPTEIKDVLIETIYGDQKDGSSRHNRASDDRILDEVCTF